MINYPHLSEVLLKYKNICDRHIEHSEQAEETIQK